MKGLVFLYDILFLFCMLLSLNSRSARGLPTCLGLLSFPILPSSHVHTTPHLSSCIVCFCVFLAFVFAHRWLVLTAPLVEPNTRFIHQHRIMRLFTRQYVYFMSIQLSFICLRLYKFLLWSKGLKLDGPIYETSIKRCNLDLARGLRGLKARREETFAKPIH